MIEQVIAWLRAQEQSRAELQEQVLRHEERLAVLEKPVDPPPVDPPPVDPPPVDPPPPPPQGPAQANCYVTGGNDTVVVSSMSELAQAANNAPPGREIAIAPGVYDGGRLALTGKGKARAPITIRPRDGPRTVTINNAKWVLDPSSEWLVVFGLDFNGPFNTISGAHNRVTRCKFQRISSQTLRVDRATDLRIDHCDFSDWTDIETIRNCIKFDPTGFSDGTNVRALIDHNFFHDIKPSTGQNGCEIIGMWAMVKNFDLPMGSVASVTQNLFQDIDITPQRLVEDELITLKSGGWSFSFNTVLRVNMNLRHRQCNNTETRSNWFENSRGHVVDVYGDRHLVIGNRFVNNSLFIGAGNTTWDEMQSQPAATGGHMAARNCRVIGNMMDNAKIVVGYALTGFNVPAQDTNLYGNPPDSIEVRAASAKGTTFEPDLEPYATAVKLTPSDVGLGAPDPYCP